MNEDRLHMQIDDVERMTHEICVMLPLVSSAFISMTVEMPGGDIWK